MVAASKLNGPRMAIDANSVLFPEALRSIRYPPKCLYLIGDPEALEEGLAVVGSRKATPYGLGCVQRFAGIAASRGIAIISGGARGCDSESHKTALEHGAKTVVFLGGGCDCVYPPENLGLFQEIIDRGGVVASENEWNAKPLRHYHRMRNRLIAGLAKATLIVEAGLPSGTFTTADDAIEANREVLVVPGAITSKQSHGANRLIYQGATPVVDDESFTDQLDIIFGKSCLAYGGECNMDSQTPISGGSLGERLFDALGAEQLTLERMREIVSSDGEGAGSLGWVMRWLADMETSGMVVKYPNGRYGAAVRVHDRRPA